MKKTKFELTGKNGGFFMEDKTIAGLSIHIDQLHSKYVNKKTEVEKLVKKNVK